MTTECPLTPAFFLSFAIDPATLTPPINRRPSYHPTVSRLRNGAAPGRHRIFAHHLAVYPPGPEIRAFLNASANSGSPVSES
jgi:hypothetical protein